MAKFSLINVSSEIDGLVSGYWIQDHIGTLTSAKEYASEVSILNHGADVAVVDEIMSTTPGLTFHSGLKRL